MGTLRKPYQGVLQILSFNRHFYLFAFIGLLLAGYGAMVSSGWLAIGLRVAILLFLLTTAISLLVSHYVYDRSDLYRFSWLPAAISPHGKDIVHIHAGFDEASALIQVHFQPASMRVFDFYQPEKHTEWSIRRARKQYPPFPGTVSVQPELLPLADQAVDQVYLFLSAHEIRDAGERLAFMQEVNRILRPDGVVILTEHLRDGYNFLAYTIGFFHFHSRRSWMQSIEGSGFRVSEEICITPFIRTFILSKHGRSS